MEGEKESVLLFVEEKRIEMRARNFEIPELSSLMLLTSNKRRNFCSFYGIAHMCYINCVKSVS